MDSEYLKSNIGVALASGLAYIQRVKPDDPIATLAEFLIKHAETTDYVEKNTKVADSFSYFKEKKNVAVKNEPAVLKFEEIKKSIDEHCSTDEYITSFVAKFAEMVKGNAYLGKVTETGESLTYVASSQAFMVQKQLPNNSVSFDVFATSEATEPSESEEAPKSTDKVSPLLHISNVLMDPRTPRLKFFGSRQFGAFACVGFSFLTHTFASFKQIIEHLSDPSISTPELEESKLNELKNDASLLTSTSKFILSVDTISQNRDFSEEELAFITTVGAEFMKELKTRIFNDFWMNVSVLHKIHVAAVKNLHAIPELQSSESPTSEVTVYQHARSKLTAISESLLGLRQLTEVKGSEIVSALIEISGNKPSYNDWKSIKQVLSADMIGKSHDLEPNDVPEDFTLLTQKISIFAVDDFKSYNLPLATLLTFVQAYIKYKAFVVSEGEKKRAEQAAAELAAREAEELAAREAAAREAAEQAAKEEENAEKPQESPAESDPQESKPEETPAE